MTELPGCLAAAVIVVAVGLAIQCHRLAFVESLAVVHLA